MHQYVTHLTLHNRYVYQAILCSLDQFISKLQENVEFLALCAKEFVTKWQVTGKGANAMISCVDYYFKHYGLGEHHVHLHADNCAGQNKNSVFLSYLTYRILLKLHGSITYSFLEAGHTKFGPDRSFGLIKKVYKVTHVSSLYEFARLVETSSNSGLNKAQLVGTHDGRIIVPVHDWMSFLGQYFRKFPNFKKCHHFRFSEQNPGMVYYKEFVNSPE